MRLLLSFVLKVLAVTLLLVSIASAIARLRVGEWMLLSAQVIELVIALGLWRLGSRLDRGGSGGTRDPSIR